MNYEHWKDIAELIGLAAIVASLVFVGIEVRQTGEIADKERRDRFQENARELNALMVNNADVWARGCMGEELSPAEQVRFTYIWRSFIQHNSTVWASLQDSNPLGTDPTSFTDSIARNQHRFPGFRMQREAQLRWLGLDGNPRSEFGQTLTVRLAEFQELEPEPLSDVRFCGF